MIVREKEAVGFVNDSLFHVKPHLVQNLIFG